MFNFEPNINKVALCMYSQSLFGQHKFVVSRRRSSSFIASAAAAYTRIRIRRPTTDADADEPFRANLIRSFVRPSRHPVLVFSISGWQRQRRS